MKPAFSLAVAVSICCLSSSASATTYGASLEYIGMCSNSTAISTLDVASAQFYDMSGTCVQTQADESYKATATSLQKWEDSPTCDSGGVAADTTVNANTPDCGAGGGWGQSYSSDYKSNALLGDYLFYYKAYPEPGTCNTAGTQPASGPQYSIIAQPASCVVQSQTIGNGYDAAYQSLYQVSEISYGSLPSYPGPFVQVNTYKANFSSAATPCAGKGPNSIADVVTYYPASATGVCTTTGAGESVKVTVDANGAGSMAWYGQNDCSSIPTYIVKSAASVTTPNTTGSVIRVVNSTCSEDYISFTGREQNGQTWTIDWSVTTPTVYANQWINTNAYITRNMSNVTDWADAYSASHWPTSETKAWACKMAKNVPRVFELLDSSICILGAYLVTAPPQSSTVTQQFTFSQLALTDYVGDTKLTYETGYGLSVGIFNAVSGWMQGCTVTSSATASSRRTGVAITFEAVVPQTQAATVSTAALAVTATTMSTNIATASTTLATSVTAPTAAQTTVAVHTTQQNADPTTRSILGPSASSAGREVHFATLGFAGMLLALALVRAQ